MEPTKIPGPTKRLPRWTGILLFFGCFVGLCALFSLVVTAGVAWQEYREAHWPEATATIQFCDVEKASVRSSSKFINCRIGYASGNETAVSHVHSVSTVAPENLIWEFSPGQAQEMIDKMQAWVEAHPPGTPIAVHYDPANHAITALVATDMPLGGPQTPRNVRFTEGTVASSAALLMIAIFARRILAK